MKYIFLLFLALLTACKDHKSSPVGQEYLLINRDSPMPITLGFNPDGRFYGKAVNTYWGQYHIRENVISFSGITSTMESDISPKMRAEREYFDALINGHSFEIKEEELKIFFDEKGVLIFKIK